MSDVSTLVSKHLVADNEAGIEAQLLQLRLRGAGNDVLAIYPRGSKVYAWVRIEQRHLTNGPTPVTPEKVTKKKAKKKVQKKAS